jgi:hypothetical protein
MFIEVLEKLEMKLTKHLQICIFSRAKGFAACNTKTLEVWHSIFLFIVFSISIAINLLQVVCEVIDAPGTNIPEKSSVYITAAFNEHFVVVIHYQHHCGGAAILTVHTWEGTFFFFF